VAFLLSKLLPLLLYPLGLCLLLQVAALTGRRRRWSLWMGGSATALLWICSMPLTARQLIWGLEQRSAGLTPDPVPQADAVLVLGGGLAPGLPPRSGVEVNEAGDRLLTGLRLMRTGRAPVLLLSGGAVTFRRGDPAPAEAVSARQLAIELGMDPSRILLSPAARTTSEEARALAGIGRARGWRSVLLVTSALHMPRALASFQRGTGLRIIPVACDYLLPARAWMGTPTPGSVIGSVLPDTGALDASTLVIKEHLGMLVYRLRGEG
jgi:uncharacterized SAM-binding protein YcdF (DUF218 family)